MEPREQIVEQALSLTPEDRVDVADALEHSLTPTGFATPEIAAEWATEIERRIAAYDRGEVQGLEPGHRRRPHATTPCEIPSR